MLVVFRSSNDYLPTMDGEFEVHSIPFDDESMIRHRNRLLPEGQENMVLDSLTYIHQHLP